MARNEHTPEDIEFIAAELIRSGELLKSVASEMRRVNMPNMLLHSTMYQNVHLPATIEFAMKVELDSVSQIRAHVGGIASRVETRKKYHASQKLSESSTKKPKATKKKPQ